jgi:hypothetical protein
LLELMRSDGIGDGVLHRATIHWWMEACQWPERRCSVPHPDPRWQEDMIARIIAGRGGRFSTWEESKC